MTAQCAFAAAKHNPIYAFSGKTSNGTHKSGSWMATNQQSAAAACVEKDNVPISAYSLHGKTWKFFARLPAHSWASTWRDVPLRVLTPTRKSRQSHQIKDLLKKITVISIFRANKIKQTQTRAGFIICNARGPALAW